MELDDLTERAGELEEKRDTIIHALKEIDALIGNYEEEEGRLENILIMLRDETEKLS